MVLLSYEDFYTLIKHDRKHFIYVIHHLYQNELQQKSQ